MAILLEPGTFDLGLALAKHGLRPATGMEPFATRRPDQWSGVMLTRDGNEVVAKAYPGGLEGPGGRAWANGQAVWRSSFGERRRPAGVPRPLDCLVLNGADATDGPAGAGGVVILMERMPGRPMAELRVDGDRLEQTMRMLAELHAADIEGGAERGSRAVVRSAARKAARLAELAPAHGALARDVVAALEAGRVKERELVPAHGDFSPRNVLVVPGAGGDRADERLVFIDWDRFQRADPARDVAYFATYGWGEILERGRMPGRDDLRRAAAAYEAARPGAKLGRALRFHVAAGCVRRAASLVELWPERAWLAPAWLRVALRELGAEPGAGKD